MLSKIAIFSEPRISVAQYFINIFSTAFRISARHGPAVEATAPPPQGTKKGRTDLRSPRLCHNLRLILHIVVIVVAHIAGFVRQLIGTLQFVIAVIVVVIGAVVGRIVYLDVYLD